MLFWIAFATLAAVALALFLMRTKSPDAPAAPAAAGVQPVAPSPPSPPTPDGARAAPPRDNSRREDLEEQDVDATVMRPLDPALLRAKNSQASTKAAPQHRDIPNLSEDEDADVDATVMREIPAEVLAFSAKSSSRPPPPSPGDGSDEASGAGADDPSDEAPGASLMLVTGSARTDVGKRRKRNEDSHALVPEKSLFVVADGMGGHAAGDVASQLAIDTIIAATPDDEPGARGKRDRGAELVAAIQQANAAIFARAKSDKGLHGMGTTVVAARFSANARRVYIAHVGDSRIYRIRKGDMTQLTRDHTYAEAVGAKGSLGAQLTRAVGIADQTEVELMVEAPQADDHYLLCSDGLTKMLSDDVICETVLEDINLERVAQRLVELSNEQGGRDNITVILIRVDELRESRNPTSRA
jgi:PPM family protein phosphatase